MNTRLLTVALAVALLSACAPVPVTLGPAITNTASGAPTETPVPTSTAIPIPIDSPTPPPTATPVPVKQEFLAYIYNGQLLVTDVTNGVIGGTTQYTVQGESDKVYDVQWSPSGEYIAFTAAPKGDQHIFYIFAEGASTPTDLGLGSNAAWSPDSKSVAYIGGTYPDENIFMTTIDNPSPVQLTHETNHAWGRPAFTPGGTALIVTTADRFNMGAQGNTSFTLEKLALDGSGTRTALPGNSSLDGVRLPYDLRFSPDGKLIGFSTSFHLSACASPGKYYAYDPASGNLIEMVSASLDGALDPNKELYYVGLSYAWMPNSNWIVSRGPVVNCDINSADMGKTVAGPQMSPVALDNSEGRIIPGMFYSPSVDRTGNMVAAAHYQDLQDLNPKVEIYSAQSGELITTVGPGNGPIFQP